jgi:hypothetical protein
MRKSLAAATAAALVLAAGAGGARDKKPQLAQQRPEAFEALVRCRAIADDQARLRCFDSASKVLEQAAESRDLVVVDRKQIRETRRSLFGLDLPRLAIFGGGDGDKEQEEVSSIDSEVASALQDGNGRWIVRLADGSTWAQTDNEALALRPRAGQKVKIKRAAMGSYMMNVNNQPGVRVKRQL